MKNVRLFAFLFLLTFLLGCTLPTTQMSQTGASPSLTGNWQIQAGTAITSPPIAPYLVGAIVESGSTLTGTFATAQPGPASPTVENYSGTYDATTGSMILTSGPPLTYGPTIATLAVPSNPTTLSTGTLLFQCGLCNNGLLLSAVGVEIAPLNGTYTGTLYGTLITPPSTTAAPISGTASVTLTQSTTPNSSGQFPLTGTVTFPSSAGAGTAPLTGMVSGVGITLNNPQPCGQPPVCNVVAPPINLTAYTNPTATQITVSNLSYEGQSTVALAGSLTLQ